MQRWDIINHFIKKNNYVSYLEIGYYKGWSFDRVECKEKTAVDPNPCKTPEQEKAPYNTLLSGETPMEDIYKKSSDDFFASITSHSHWKFDIIFIDGLHEASQVSKDIQNSLNHLSPNGVILLHDCNPPLYEHTTTGIDGCWTGDTYKAILALESQFPKGFDYYTIDTDWGVGVIKPLENHSNNKTELERNLCILAVNNWKLFDTGRELLLNLISVEEFLKREPI